MACLAVRITISDQERWPEYRAAVVPLISDVGGKRVTKGGSIERFEGHDDGRRIAVFEFLSVGAIHAFWNSPEHIPLKGLRRGAATLDVWAVPGG